jgi:hypothetical protein
MCVQVQGSVEEENIRRKCDTTRLLLACSTSLSLSLHLLSHTQHTFSLSLSPSLPPSLPPSISLSLARSLARFLALSLSHSPALSRSHSLICLSVGLSGCQSVCLLSISSLSLSPSLALALALSSPPRTMHVCTRACLHFPHVCMFVCVHVSRILAGMCCDCRCVREKGERERLQVCVREGCERATYIYIYIYMFRVLICTYLLICVHVSRIAYVCMFCVY